MAKYRPNHTAGRRRPLPGARYGSTRKREAKVVDLPVTIRAVPLFSISPTGVIGPIYGNQSLNYPVQGAAIQNRIGNKISMQYVSLKGNIYSLQSNGALAGTTFRIMIVYDKQTNGAIPAYSDIVSSVNPSGTASNSIVSHRNPYNRDRFLILYDSTRYVAFQNLQDATKIGNNIVTASSYLNLDIFVPLKGLETMYGANNGNIGDVKTGGLFLVLCTDDGTTSYSSELCIRLGFEDY